MRNMKKFLKKAVVSMFAAAVLLAGLPSSVACADYDDVKPRNVKITVKKKTVKQGKHFKLRAKMKPYYADDDQLIWSIVKGKKVIRFEDNDRDGNDAEFIALKKGTAKVCCRIRGTRKKAYVTVKVKASKAGAGGTIRRVGPETRTVLSGSEFELEVHKSAGVRERDLKWSIGDTSVVWFEDDDRYDDEMDFRAVGAGTTEITCTNTKTGKAVSFTVKVI